MTPELSLQKAVRARFISHHEVVALVPAASILDRNERPAPSPSIVIGEAQSVDENDSLSRNRLRIYLDLHVWKAETGTIGVKAIAGAIRKALVQRLDMSDDGFHCIDCFIRGARYLRDPDGKTAHAVVTVSAKVQEVD